MDVRRLSPSGRALWILVLAGLWLPMVQLGSSSGISLQRRSNSGESEGSESIKLTVASCNIRTCIHGSCSSQDKCICDYGYKGPDCKEVTSCNTRNCIHGGCSLNDTCTCVYGYHGPSCDEVSDTNPSRCNSLNCKYGSCVSGQCVCKSGYRGATCASLIMTPSIILVLAWSPFYLLLLCNICFCTCCETGLWPCLRYCTCCKRDTKKILTTAKVKDNVYDNIAVIST